MLKLMFPNLKVENLSCVRSETALFENLNFEVSPGQNLEIIGSNGSGKTTLLRIILGLAKQESGQVNWLNNENEYNAYRTFNCFYQGHNLAIKNLLTVYENLYMTKISSSLPEEKILESLKRVGLTRFHDFAGNLSVGQRKRISIARWLLDEYKIYFIDEPFSALDDEAAKLIEELIIELNDKGSSFVITGHRPSNIEAQTLYL